MAVINLIKKKGVNPLTKQAIFFPQWTRRSTDTAMELAEEMDGSTYSQGEITGMLVDFPKRIVRSLLNGNAVSVDGLGTFKLKVTGKSDPDPDKVTVRGAKATILFEPDPSLNARLEAEAEFKLVTTPTSEGEQDANSAETPSTTDDTTTNTDTTDNTQSGGDDNGGDGNGGDDNLEP